nr:MAG TPA: hypothetical protein [Bacteriophage sp.]
MILLTDRTPCPFFLSVRFVGFVTDIKLKTEKS